MNERIGYAGDAPMPVNESLQGVVNETAAVLTECHGILDTMLGSPTAAPQGPTSQGGLSSSAFASRTLAIELRQRLGQLRELTGNIG